MSFLFFSDFDQLPNNIPISATIADIEEKKGFIDYFVRFNSRSTFTVVCHLGEGRAGASCGPRKRELFGSLNASSHNLKQF